MRHVLTAGLIVAAVAWSSAASALASTGVTGAAWAFGANQAGQLGNGTTTNANAPQPVTLGATGTTGTTGATGTTGVSGPSRLTNVTQVAAGGSHTLALTTTGTVLAWGSNLQGQLGDGGNTSSALPVTVLAGVEGTGVPAGTPLTNIVQIAAGGGHSLAVTAGGDVYAWGANSNGQLGNGTTTNSPVPVAVVTSAGVPLAGVTAVAAGLNFSLALTSGGNVYAWGSNAEGQLSNGTTATGSTTAVEVGSSPSAALSGITAIAAGEQFGLALTSGGGVESWGLNADGELGNGTTTTSPVPGPVQTITTGSTGSTGSVGVPISGIQAIAAGGFHALALQSTGGVLSWGQNTDGQLGDNSNVGSDTPVQVLGEEGGGTLGAVSEIAAGDTDSLAISGVETLAWGNNASGQLGDGPTPNALSPIPIGSSPPVFDLGTGCCSDHSAVVTEQPPTVTGVSPLAGPATGDTQVTITGTGFQFVTSVMFGETPATSFATDGNGTITAVSPANTGLVDVTAVSAAGTSPTSPADRFGFQAAPTATDVGETVTATSSTATFTGTVNPNGLPTSARFHYGPQAATGPGSLATPEQSVGSDYSDHTVTATVTGLTPGRTYHVQLQAGNSIGTQNADVVTFNTPAVQPPVEGRTVNLARVSGTVLIKLRGKKRFARLSSASQIPVGSTINAVHGRVALTSAKGRQEHAGTQTAQFYDGTFVVGQTRGKAVTTLALTGGASCRSTRHGATDHGAADSGGIDGGPVAFAAKRKPQRKLWGSGHGSFTTKGTYASASVLGTIWLTEDFCDGTLIRVVRDSVRVKDFVTHKTVTIRAPHSFFAAAPGARR